MRRWRMVLALSTVLALLVPATVGMAANPFGNTVSLWAQLRGDTETPPGDPDGFGFAKVTIDLDSGDLCYRLSVAGTDTPVAAHIHQGMAGENGPVVVPFDAPADGLAKGCGAVDEALLYAIVANPAGYYVNIHSGAYPAGVVRGQLTTDGTAPVGPPPVDGPTVETIVDGLNGPRGLVVMDDGSIYVAQAGVGGDDCVTDTSGEDPVERCFGPTGEISMVMPGMVHPVLTGLPSYGFSPPEYVGPQDVVVGDDGEVYGIVGLGMDPAIRDAAGDPAAGLGTVVTSDGAGGWESVLDVSAYELEANPDGGLPDSNPFQAVMTADGWAITDAGANALLWVDTAGNISTLAVFPETMADAPPFLGLPPGTQIPMQAVPTGLAQGPDGAWYVGQLTGFPFVDSAAKVWRVMPGEAPTVYAEGFTNIVDIAFDADGNLWVLEITAGGLLNVDPEVPATLAGGLYRVGPDGHTEEMLSEGLVTPSGLTVGPDGAIYISNYGLMPGMGEILKVTWD